MRNWTKSVCKVEPRLLLKQQSRIPEVHFQTIGQLHFKHHLFASLTILACDGLLPFYLAFNVNSLDSSPNKAYSSQVELRKAA